MTATTAVWKKEFRRELCTWKSSLWLVVASLLLSFTSYLLLTNKELSLLDQTELMWLLAKVIIGVALLIVAIEASATVAGEFESGTAESVLLTPLSLWDFVKGKFLSVLTLWTMLFAVSLPYIVVAATGSGETLAFIAYAALLGTLVVIGFTAFIFGLALFFRSSKNTLMTSLVTLLALAAPALFSSTLKTGPVLQAVSAVNPVENVFAALDYVLVDAKFSPLSNAQYLLPLLIFCVVTVLFLWYAVRTASRQAVVQHE